MTSAPVIPAHLLNSRGNIENKRHWQKILKTKIKDLQQMLQGKYVKGQWKLNIKSLIESNTMQRL